MNKKLLVVIASALVANAAVAQSAFQGFYGQVGTGYENNTVQNAQMTVSSAQGSASTTGAGTATSGTAPLVVGLGYTFMLDPKFTLGLGIDYSTLSSNTGNVTGTWTDSEGGTGSWSYKISNRYNIFLSPGYVISKDQLAYAKIGYSNQKVEAQNQTAGEPNYSLGSANTSGYVLGLGYKQMITGGIYAFGEANYYNYSKPSITSTINGFNSSVNPGVNAYNFLVGVGYKF